MARKLGITITGTIGAIVKAKQNGIISSIKPVLKKIKDTNFRISSEIEKMALKIANETQ